MALITLLSRSSQYPSEILAAPPAGGRGRKAGIDVGAGAGAGVGASAGMPIEAI